MPSNLFVVALLLRIFFSNAVNPVSKVVDLITGMQQFIVKEGHEAQQFYTEFAEMCEDHPGSFTMK